MSQFPVVESTDNSIGKKKNHVHVNISTLEEKHRWTIGVYESLSEFACQVLVEDEIFLLDSLMVFCVDEQI